MDIYLSPISAPGSPGRELYGELVNHLELRGVSIANTSELNPDLLPTVGGLIVELSYQHEDELKLIELASKLGKPVLALVGRHSQSRAILENFNGESVRKVAYSQLYIATVTIDVFLEAHCGYRVPLGSNDRLQKLESKDGY